MGSVGRPLPGLEVKIVDPKTDEELEDGQPGELCVRGHAVMIGYYNQPEETAAAINEDGSYRLEAVPGTYQVGIASPPELPAGREAFEQPAPPSLVPDWYGYPGRSGIEVTVEEKEENVFDIALQ